MKNESHILKASKNNIKNYVNSLDLSDDIKKRILDSNFFCNTPSFYFYYPFLFVPKNTIDNNLKLISISGFLFYQSSIVLDDIVDDKDYSKLSLLFILQEEAIKILATLFDLESNFWSIWNKRRGQFLSSIEIENLFRVNQNLLSLNDFENLSIFKAAFANANIDALFTLNYIKTNKKYFKILKSHEYFSISLQINDDILDFVDDFKSGQYNIAVSRSKSLINNNSLKSAKREFYLSGIASKLFLEAISYLNKALDEISGFKLIYWENEIKGLKKKFENSILEISYFNYFHVTKSKCSSALLINNSYKSALEKGINFLKIKQNLDGSWMEFITEAGISDVWSTAFITYFLSEDLKFKSRFKENISRSIKFLKKNKSDLIWGYNKNWIDDLDSTNMVFLSFHFNNEKIKEFEFNEWLDYYIDGNGFSTYNNPELLLKSLDDNSISSVSAWISSHQCVSAVSFYFLIISDLNESKLKELELIFIELVKSNKVVSFWWTSVIYTYYFLFKSFQLLNNQDMLNFIQNEIIIILNTKDFFEDLYGKNVFYTSLVLEILLFDIVKNRIEIEQLKNYLLSQQYEDGSFRNSTSLFIPDPEFLNLSNEFFNSSTLGTSVCSIEFSRLFSTVVAIKSLNEYGKRVKSTKII